MPLPIELLTTCIVVSAQALVGMVVKFACGTGFTMILSITNVLSQSLGSPTVNSMV